MDEEMKELQRNETWEIAFLPQGKRVIGYHPKLSLYPQKG